MLIDCKMDKQVIKRTNKQTDNLQQNFSELPFTVLHPLEQPPHIYI